MDEFRTQILNIEVSITAVLKGPGRSRTVSYHLVFDQH
jgi:hypothetical protein